MLVKEIVDLIDGNVLIGEEILSENIENAFSSDLMSDVLAHVGVNAVLLTGLNNQQVIRTAEMLDLKAIVFVRGKIPAADLLELAKENEIAIISTRHTLYTASGILFAKGLAGIQI